MCGKQSGALMSPAESASEEYVESGPGYNIPVMQSMTNVRRRVEDGAFEISETRLNSWIDQFV